MSASRALRPHSGRIAACELCPLYSTENVLNAIVRRSTPVPPELACVIIATIFAHSIAVPSDEATLFITQLNQLIDETRTAYNLRKGITASNKNKGQGGNDERPGEL